MPEHAPVALRMAHIDLWSHVLRVDYLETLFGRLAAAGYNAVLLAYRDKFPYTTHPELAAADAYTPADIAQIDAAARRHGLQLVPLGHQFSHAAGIYKQPRFAHLVGDGGGLDLLNPESVEVVASAARDILAAHPGVSLVHFGGDEMGGVGTRPAIGRFVRAHGISEYFVRFVNQLVTALRTDGVRVGIWSDMLIRYPEALAQLDTGTVIFYWDYWSYGERTPFVSIGGGLPDMFILDRGALTGDLRKLFLAPWPKPASDLPWGHVKQFASYWQMDDAATSVRSFPYVQWFRDHGLDVVGALTTYPEKSSFLPDFLGKFDHVRGFARRLHEHGGMGFLACLWAMHFPLPETVWPSWLAATLLMDDPERTDAEVCALAAARLGGHWTPATVEAYLGAGSDFEAADLMAPNWSIKLTLAERLEWLLAAGGLEDDMDLCRNSRMKAETLLQGPWKDIPASLYERFVLEDMVWRARLQTAWYDGDADVVPALRDEGRALERRCRVFLESMYLAAHAAGQLSTRYAPWFALLDDIAQGRIRKT
jgi:hypothetical protein